MAVRPIELTKDSSTVVYGGGSNSVTVGSVFSPIITWKVPRQVAWSIVKNPKVRAKLKDGAGNEIPANVKLMLSVKKPYQNLYQEIGTPKHYAPYRDLTLNEQLNAENDVAVRFNLKSAGTIPEESELTVLASSVSPVTVDWSKSEIYIGNVATNDLIEADL